MGYWGPKLARNLMALPGAHLHSICELRPDRVQDFSDELPGVNFVSDFDATVNNPDVDAVAIVTPAETHFTLARQALLAGKDVFVEKPLALLYEEGAELVRLAREHQRILMVGHLLEYHP